ncbi:MAG: hypothetical protein H7840_01180 [Alphaproteobacteria bacterium]
MAKPRRPIVTGSGRLAPPHSAADDTNTLKPHFSLEHLAVGDDFDLTACNQQGRAEFAVAIRDRSRMTWAEIMRAPRQGLGFEKIGSLNVTIPGTVPADKRGRIVAFRFGQLARFLGYRDGRVFHVLWIDPAGRCYSHE